MSAYWPSEPAPQDALRKSLLNSVFAHMLRLAAGTIQATIFLCTKSFKGCPRPELPCSDARSVLA